MVVNCVIEFDNNSDGCYYAGQVMSGIVTLSTDKVQQVKAVALKIKGFAHNRWDEKEFSNSSRTIYTGHEDYIDSLTFLLGLPGSSDESVQIEPGTHTFNFLCPIPTNCPSSFETHYGHIRYVVQVSLIRSWKFNINFAKGFTVLKIMDLNDDSSLLKMPVSEHLNKTFFFGPFKTDPLQIEVHLPYTGFVPGENIPVKIIVTNDTNAKVKEICLRLVMLLSLHSQRPRVHTRKENKTISTLNGDSVLALCKKQFSYLLPVPATPPTCSDKCSISEIAYRVEVEAKMEGIFYINPVVHTAVTIGNVPLKHSEKKEPMDKSEHANICSSDAEKKLDIATCTQEVSDTEKGNTPPPVYMEAAYMPYATLTVGDENNYGEEKFTPKYPVFNVLKTLDEESDKEARAAKEAEAKEST